MGVVRKIKEARLGNFARSLLLMKIRGGTLAVKFLLTVYLARFLSLEDLGVFGIVTATAIVFPTLAGLSIMQIVSRHAITRPSEYLTGELLNYGRLLACIYAIVFVVVITAGMLSGQHVFALLLCSLVLLEHVNNDMYNLLLNLSKPFSANVLHALRAAVWAVTYMVAAYVHPPLRHINAVLAFWLVGSACAFIGFFVTVRIWEWRPNLQMKPFLLWVRDAVKQSRLFYLNSLAFTAFQYLDRYLISLFLGLEMTGVYVFFWQVCSAIPNLLNTGVIQVARPKMVRAFKEGSAAYWRIYTDCRRNTLLAALLLGVLTVLLVYLVLPHLDKKRVTENFPVLYVIMFGFVVQVQHSVQALVFYSQHREDQVLRINLILFPVMVLSYMALIPIFGLWGAAASLVLFAVMKLGLQYRYVARLF